jgi:hypothetical protein
LQKRWLVSLLISIIISATIGLALGQYLNSEETLALRKTNKELLEKFEDITGELASLRKNFTDLQALLNVTSETPPIVARLGVKLMDDGPRYKYYLWVTGEVLNNGGHTAYNVTILFTLHTAEGITLRTINMGTFAPFQLLPFRYQVYAQGEYIERWEITPEASYVP